MHKILVLHGPNLNLLGAREPSIYGTQTLEALNHTLIKSAASKGVKLECEQTNAEHELIDFVHQAKADHVEFIVLNAAGLTHTSISLRDALLAAQLPFIEVHLSNTFARETFRQHSYLSDIAAGVIVGFGTLGYAMAIDAASEMLVAQTPLTALVIETVE